MDIANPNLINVDSLEATPPFSSPPTLAMLHDSAQHLMPSIGSSPMGVLAMDGSGGGGGGTTQTHDNTTNSSIGNVSKTMTHSMGQTIPFPVVSQTQTQIQNTRITQQQQHHTPHNHMNAHHQRMSRTAAHMPSPHMSHSSHMQHSNSINMNNNKNQMHLSAHAHAHAQHTHAPQHIRTQHALPTHTRVTTHNSIGIPNVITHSQPNRPSRINTQRQQQMLALHPRMHPSHPHPHHPSSNAVHVQQNNAQQSRSYNMSRQHPFSQSQSLRSRAGMASHNNARTTQQQQSHAMNITNTVNNTIINLTPNGQQQSSNPNGVNGGQQSKSQNTGDNGKSINGDIVIGDVVFDKYRVIRTLAEGTFSCTYQVLNTLTHKYRAMKVMFPKYGFVGEQEASRLSRLNACDSSDLCHVVRLIDNFMHRKRFCLVLELLGMSLFKYIETYHEMPLNLVRKIAVQLLISVDFTHRNHMIHADLKPENILLNNVGKRDKLSSVGIKVIDFGNSIALQERHRYLDQLNFDVQSLYYRAPEVLLGCKFGLPIDIWSIGCILMELIIGKPLFDCKEKQELCSQILQTLGPFPAHIYNRALAKFYSVYSVYLTHETRSLPLFTQRMHGITRILRLRISANQWNQEYDDFVQFIASLLDLDPNTRMKASQAFFHPFFQKLFPFRKVFEKHLNDVNQQSVVTHNTHNNAGNNECRMHNPMHFNHKHNPNHNNHNHNINHNIGHSSHSSHSRNNHNHNNNNASHVHMRNNNMHHHSSSSHSSHHCHSNPFCSRSVGGSTISGMSSSNLPIITGSVQNIPMSNHSINHSINAMSENGKDNLKLRSRKRSRAIISDEFCAAPPIKKPKRPL